MHTIVGHSDHPDPDAAVREVVDGLVHQLSGEVPGAALVTGSVEYDLDALIRALLDRWPGLPLIGATSDGGISSELGFCNESIVVTLFAGEGFQVRSGVGRNLSRDIEGAVAEAASDLRGWGTGMCVTTYAPDANGSAVLRQLDRELGEGECPILGGLSADHRDFSRMREFHGDEALRDSIPLLAFRGDFHVSWGVHPGCSPVGKRYRIDRAEGHVVYEIDGRPAMQFYREHYGADTFLTLSEYPLAVHADDPGWYLRTVMGSESSDGSLLFSGEILEGVEVSLTEVEPAGLLQGSASALSMALSRFEGERPEGILVFSCAGRKWVLGTQVEEEINVLRRVAAEHGIEDVPLSGSYCFGELAPLVDPRANTLHNESCMTMVVGR